jgi:hypothetical protein
VLGYKWKRVRLSLKDKRDQVQFDKQQLELEQLKELHRMEYIDLYYCDESHFGLTPNVGYAWQHKDNPILLPAAKGRRLSVFGLMTPDCKLCSWIVEGSINYVAVIAILDKFVTQITKKTVVVIDNAPIHRSKKFMAKIAEWKLQDLLIYFLPAYCPELNIIEILWKHIKYYWLPFDAFLNFQNLKQQLTSVLTSVGSKYRINYC